MKKLLFLLVILLISITTNAGRTIESVNINDLSWQKCELNIESNYTNCVIKINTEIPQIYTFNYINSYPDKIQGEAVNNNGEKVYICMYFNKEFTYMIIIHENGLLIKYIIN